MLSLAGGAFWNAVPENHDPIAAIADRVTDQAGADSPTTGQHILARTAATGFPALLPADRMGRTFLLSGANEEGSGWDRLPGTKSAHVYRRISDKQFPAERSSAPLFLLHRNLRT